MFSTLLDRFKRDRAAREKGERDAPADLGDPTSRATGGGPSVSSQDANSTTGTTASGSFVGRAGGDEAGDVGPSGGEVRAGMTDLSHEGAARPAGAGNSTESAQEAEDDRDSDLVDEMSEESFPTSDPPSTWGGPDQV